MNTSGCRPRKLLKDVPWQRGCSSSCSAALLQCCSAVKRASRIPHLPRRPNKEHLDRAVESETIKSPTIPDWALSSVVGNGGVTMGWKRWVRGPSFRVPGILSRDAREMCPWQDLRA